MRIGGITVFSAFVGWEDMNPPSQNLPNMGCAIRFTELTHDTFPSNMAEGRKSSIYLRFFS